MPTCFLMPCIRIIFQMWKYTIKKGHFQIFILNAFLLYISYSLSLSFKCTEVYRLCSQGKLTKKQRVTVSAVLGDNVWLLGIICLQNAQACWQHRLNPRSRCQADAINLCPGGSLFVTDSSSYLSFVDTLRQELLIWSKLFSSSRLHFLWIVSSTNEECWDTQVCLITRIFNNKILILMLSIVID